MNPGKITKLTIPSLNEFEFQIKYTETNQKMHVNEIDLHTHNEFEIYVNVSGDVSFLVENNLYDLTRGDVIIARPGEQHHCVYRSDAPHKLYWILFDCRKNENVFDFDFDGNYISPQGDFREELLELCHALHDCPISDEEKIYSFFRILTILKKSKRGHSEMQSVLSPELSNILKYIDRHIREEVTIASIAKEFYMSQSTLERKFKELLDIPPSEYIRRKKLVIATELLHEGKSVLNAGMSVGYSDTSYFIEIFKRYYGITPHQYKKKLSDYNKSNNLHTYEN